MEESKPTVLCLVLMPENMAVAVEALSATW